MSDPRSCATGSIGILSHHMKRLTLKQAPKASLLNLPLEIRQLVLEHAIDHPLPATDLSDRYDANADSRARRTASVLFLTSKQFQQEMVFVIKKRVPQVATWALELSDYQKREFYFGMGDNFN